MAQGTVQCSALLNIIEGEEYSNKVRDCHFIQKDSVHGVA